MNPTPTGVGSRLPNPAEPGRFGVVLIRDGVHGAAAAADVRQEAAAGRHRAADRRDRGQPEFTVTHGNVNGTNRMRGSLFMFAGRRSRIDRSVK